MDGQFNSEDEEIPMNMFQSCKCLLVTDDEMGDLLFQLLGTSFFPSSKENHQATSSVISFASPLRSIFIRAPTFNISPQTNPQATLIMLGR
ncbi:hypothetical protein YC2023_042522 [Brassica napus]